MAAVFLMSTVGFEVYHNFCECIGNDYVSLFVDDECCHEVGHSCVVDMHEEHNQPDHDNACGSQHTFVQFSQTYVPSQKLQIIPVFTVLFQISFFGFEVDDIAKTETNICLNTHPLLHGKDLVYFIQSPKIPDSLL